MNKKLKDKIETNRKLVEDLRELGVEVDFNEETGEYIILSDEHKRQD